MRWLRWQSGSFVTRGPRVRILPSLVLFWDQTKHVIAFCKKLPCIKRNARPNIISYQLSTKVFISLTLKGQTMNDVTQKCDAKMHFYLHLSLPSVTKVGTPLPPNCRTYFMKVPKGKKGVTNNDIWCLWLMGTLDSHADWTLELLGEEGEATKK